jgi:hypothetical protein
MSDYPFKNSVFWCNVFPPDVYAALDAMWIPQTFMKQDRQNDVRHGSRYVRFKASLPSYLNISDARGDQCVPPPASTLLLVVGLATGSAVRERPHRLKASLPSYLNISDARGDQCVPPPASTLLLVVGLATGSAVRERPHRLKASLPSYLNISDARGDQCVPPPASTLLLVVGLATGSAVRERPHTASTSTALSAQLAGSLRLRRDAPSSTSAPETLDGVCQVHLHPAIVPSQLALHHSRGASGCMRVRPMCSV